MDRFLELASKRHIKKSVLPQAGCINKSQVPTASHVIGKQHMTKWHRLRTCCNSFYFTLSNLVL